MFLRVYAYHLTYICYLVKCMFKILVDLVFSWVWFHFRFSFVYLVRKSNVFNLQFWRLKIQMACYMVCKGLSCCVTMRECYFSPVLSCPFQSSSVLPSSAFHTETSSLTVVFSCTLYAMGTTLLWRSIFIVNWWALNTTKRRISSSICKGISSKG